MEASQIAVVPEHSLQLKRAKRFSAQNNASLSKEISDGQLQLVFACEGVYINIPEKNSKSLKVKVDFVAGVNAYRRKHGGGKGQNIAKAIGLNKGYISSVLDATAGLGGDAFVLAALGCKVSLIERSPFVAELLRDGLDRARIYSHDTDVELLEIIERMSFIQGDSLALMAKNEIAQHDVVYLDPMFPEQKKTALVKKEMRAFHKIIGFDDDAGDLFKHALALAKYRVVVKRPRIAPFLDDRSPSFQLKGKSSRYDIYALKKFPTS